MIECSAFVERGFDGIGYGGVKAPYYVVGCNEVSISEDLELNLVWEV